MDVTKRYFSFDNTETGTNVYVGEKYQYGYAEVCFHCTLSNPTDNVETANIILDAPRHAWKMLVRNRSILALSEGMISPLDFIEHLESLSFQYVEDVSGMRE